VPGCQKLQMKDAGCFIAVPIWQQWAAKGNLNLIFHMPRRTDKQAIFLLSGVSDTVESLSAGDADSKSYTVDAGDSRQASEERQDPVEQSAAGVEERAAGPGANDVNSSVEMDDRGTLSVTQDLMDAQSSSSYYTPVPCADP